jgi:hypothetical protein
MTEPVEHILWGLQTRMQEIIRLANSPEDRRGSIDREARGALQDILDAEYQLREAKRALFNPEVSP